jgi:hypothetical protein
MQQKRLRKIFAVVGLCLLIGVAAIGQVVTTGQGRLVLNPPTGVVLLPGYQNERFMGADSSQGRIWKNQGLEIRYEGGMGAGNRVDRNASNLAWSRDHTVGTSRAQVAMTRDRVLLITFSPLPTARGPMLNFYATIRSEEDIVDTLVMVMGYRP